MGQAVVRAAAAAAAEAAGAALARVADAGAEAAGAAAAGTAGAKELAARAAAVVELAMVSQMKHQTSSLLCGTGYPWGRARLVSLWVLCGALVGIGLR